MNPEAYAVNEEAKKLLAAMSAAWQPIETAPKNGTPILTWNGIHQLTMEWDDGWELFDSGSYATDNFPTFPPTHWKPLGPNPT